MTIAISTSESTVQEGVQPLAPPETERLLRIVDLVAARRVLAHAPLLQPQHALVHRAGRLLVPESHVQRCNLTAAGGILRASRASARVCRPLS